MTESLMADLLQDRIIEPIEPILQFFSYDHLPTDLQLVSEPFCWLARDIVKTLPRNAERSVALRKLLEARDAAVRAVVYRSGG